ncbi:MAG: class I SAM-dependent methyltransferase [Acidobacteria bacterium]|nr:class I SAM-dependent methyltransferase [Acidobacteriota bacterium]
MEPDSIRHHFKAQVSDYPGLMKRLVPFFDEQREILLGLIPFDREAPLRILDLGCGPGLLAARLLSEYKHAELTAFDLTQEMLDSCRSRLSGVDRVSYQLGDFRSDDLGENYDLIVAALSLHHMELEERYGFFRRAYRSLKAGGVFLASEVIADESTAVREQQYQLWREFMERNGEDSAAWYRRHCEKDHPATISFLVATLSKTGFQAPGCFWRYLNFAVLSARKAAASETTPPTR